MPIEAVFYFHLASISDFNIPVHHCVWNAVIIMPNLLSIYPKKTRHLSRWQCEVIPAVFRFFFLCVGVDFKV